MKLCAHDDEVTTLESRLAEANGEGRIALMVELAWQLRQRDTRRSLLLADDADRTGGVPQVAAARLALVRADAARLYLSLETSATHLAAARAMFQDQGDLTGEGDAAFIEAWLANDSGDTRRAIPCLEQARQCYRTVGDAERVAIIGGFLLSFSSTPVEVEPDTDDLPKSAFVTALHERARGLWFQMAGNYAQAEAGFSGAAGTLLAYGYVQLAILAYVNAGVAACNFNALERALDYHVRALRLAKARGWPNSIGQCLRAMGSHAADLGQNERAVELLSEAFELFSVIPRSSSLAAVISQIGPPLLELGRAQELLAMVERTRAASPHWREDLQLEYKSLEAGAFARLGRLTEAVALAREAQDAASRLEALPAFQNVTNTLVGIHLRHDLPGPAGMTAPTPALHYLQQMVAAQEAAGVSLPLFVVDNLSLAWEAAGDTAQALHYGREARRLAQNEELKRASDRQFAIQEEHKVEKAHLETEHHRQRAAILERSGETLELLSRIGQEITAKLEANAIFETLHRHIAGLMDVRSLLIFRLDATGTVLCCDLGIEDGVPVSPTVIALDDPHANVAAAARDRREIAIDARLDAAQAGLMPGTRPMLSLLYAPLLQGEELLGVMTIQTDKPHAYTERERSIFRTLCAYGAIAFGNAAAYRKLDIANAALRVERARADEATRTKSAFLANMSHEIRTPMNAVIGLSHLVLKSGLNPRQAAYVGKIQQSSQHLLRIIDDVLDFSKIEAGKLTIETIEFEFNQVLDIVSDVTAEKAAAKGLELRFDIDPALAPRMLGDPLRLGQVLINFCNNAVKFTDRGEIVVAVRVQEDAEPGQLVHFAVTDTGIGLSEEQIGGLFQAFRQADTSTSRKYGGTGLGLTISKSLAEAMGGQIGVTSRLGEGSSFWFTARLGKSLRAPQPRPDVPNPRRRRMPGGEAEIDVSVLRGARILLVEDNQINQEVALGLLEPTQAVCDLAENGEIALRKIQLRPYDIVLMDMQMPILDGIGATQQIRADPRLQDLPIIAMTANAMASDRDRCLEAGMNDHLPKPIDPDELFAKLTRWVKPRKEAAVPPIPGIDTAHALVRLGGNAVLYAKVLRKFAAGEADSVGRLRAALAQGDVQTAERLLHTLQGTADTLGIVGVAEAAEAALSGNSRAEAALESLSARLDLAVAAIRNALPEMN